MKQKKVFSRQTEEDSIQAYIRRQRQIRQIHLLRRFSFKKLIDEINRENEENKQLKLDR